MLYQCSSVPGPRWKALCQRLFIAFTPEIIFSLPSASMAVSNPHNYALSGASFADEYMRQVVLPHVRFLPHTHIAWYDTKSRPLKPVWLLYSHHHFCCQYRRVQASLCSRHFTNSCFSMHEMPYLNRRIGVLHPRLLILVNHTRQYIRCLEVDPKQAAELVGMIFTISIVFFPHTCYIKMPGSEERQHVPCRLPDKNQDFSVYSLIPGMKLNTSSGDRYKKLQFSPAILTNF